MFAMFKDSTTFNQTVNNWDTSNVHHGIMFGGATVF